LPSTAITRYPPARQEAQPRLWRGQEGQRPQAARRRRHDRATAVRADHRRRRPGPRRGETAAVEPGTWNPEPAESLPLGQAHLGRRRIRRQVRHLGQEQAQATAEVTAAW